MGDQTPKSEMVETLTDAADRFLKWVYKQPYSGPPVISIPRHDGNIDAILADAATRVAGLEAENARLTAALSKIAEGTAPPEPHGHYLAHRACVDIARAALKPEGGS